MIYPWQQKQWEQYQSARQAQHLAHALLLSGLKDCGKQHFAKTIAHSLLCQSPDSQGYACGQCKSCQVFSAESHPDYKAVSLLEDKKDISIAQIRELGQFLSLSRSYGTYKVAVITDADRMNENAANSLLKTLEEPSDNTVIVLESSQPSSLLPTIQSRCQQIVFSLPNNEAALNWLNQQQTNQSPDVLLSIASGRPLLAKQIDEGDFLDKRIRIIHDLLALLKQQKNHVEIAKSWEKEDFQTLLAWQLTWVQDLLFIHQKIEQKIQSIDLKEQLKQLFSLLNAARLWTIYDNLLDLLKLAKHPVNKTLFSEKMLLIWV